MYESNHSSGGADPSPPPSDAEPPAIARSAAIVRPKSHTPSAASIAAIVLPRRGILRPPPALIGCTVTLRSSAAVPPTRRDANSRSTRTLV